MFEVISTLLPPPWRNRAVRVSVAASPDTPSCHMPVRKGKARRLYPGDAGSVNPGAVALKVADAYSMRDAGRCNHEFQVVHHR